MNEKDTIGHGSPENRQEDRPKDRPKYRPEKNLKNLENRPDWLSALCSDDLIELDVRPVLATGEDPLTQILAMASGLSGDDILRIEAPFNPHPLRKMMASKGFDSFGAELGPRHWEVFFKYQDSVTLPPLPDVADLPPFPLYWHEDILHMDLRRLEPPNPMIAILKTIESGQGGDAFHVKLARDPIYLYPELAERCWQAKVIEENENDLKVIICKGVEK